MTWKYRAHFVTDRSERLLQTTCGLRLRSDWPHDGVLCQACEKDLETMLYRLGLERRPPLVTEPMPWFEWMMMEAE